MQMELGIAFSLDESTPPLEKTSELHERGAAMKTTRVRIVRILSLFGFAVVGFGCAEAPPPSKPAVVFPTRDEIAAIPAAKPNLEAFGEVDTSNEPWAVEVEPTPEDAPYVDTSAWGDFIRASVNAHARNVSLAPPMKCASDELAKINRRSPKLVPPMNLVQFIVARCGAMVTSPRPIVWRAETTGNVPDDQIFDAAKKALSPLLEKAFAGAGNDPLVVGLGVARDDKGISVVVTLADRRAVLDPTPLRADANHLVNLRGTVRGDYASIVALVNQGPLGYARCTPQGDFPPPHFAFTCKLADGDPYAWVEILGQRKGAVLERDLAAGILTSGTDAPIVYKSHSDSPPVIVGTPAELSAAIAAGVNRARANAQLPPLAFDAKQSIQNTRLVGTLVNATVSEDVSGASDRAAVGLLAGWDVTGTIRNATIYIAAIAPTHDATAWLDWALEKPGGRETLLEPSSRVIAIGPAVPAEGSALGAAVTTYAMFQSDDHTAEEKALFARIDASRTARGLVRPTHLLAGFPAIREEAAHVLKDSENPMTALSSMLSTASASNGGSGAMGYVIETNDVDHCTIPDAVMNAPSLHLAVAVTHHRAEGAAWGQYVIFLVTVGSSSVSPGLEVRSSYGVTKTR